MSDMEALAAQIAMATGGYQPMPEYSTSKGFLPMDIGTANSNRNMLAGMVGGGDMMPFVVALLNGTYDESMFAPDTSEQDAAYNKLNAIIDSSGPQSVEGMLANEILNGASPSEAVGNLEFYMTDQGLLDDVTDLDKWRDNVSKVANGYFDDKIASDTAVPKETDGSRLAKLMGLPADLSAEFTPDLLNPELEAMRGRAADDASVLRESRAADQLKYTQPQQEAMQNYLSGEEVLPPGRQGEVANAMQHLSDLQNYTYEAPLTPYQQVQARKEAAEAAMEQARADGASPYEQTKAASDVRRAAPTPARERGEPERGNMAQIPAGQFLSQVGPMQTNRWSSESVSAQNKALHSNFMARQAQADAEGLAAALAKRGINPTQLAMQAFMGGGQRLFGA